MKCRQPKRKKVMMKEVFNSEWCSKYLVAHRIKVLSASSSKIRLQFDEILGQARADKIEHRKKFIEKLQSDFTSY